MWLDMPSFGSNALPRCNGLVFVLMDGYGIRETHLFLVVPGPEVGVDESRSEAARPEVEIRADRLGRGVVVVVTGAVDSG